VGPLAACSSSDGNAAAAEAVAAGTMVIDVRTPEEFAGGHLDGAVNMNLQSPAFASQLAGLDPSADYLVYCRSGNRSGQAIDQMRAAGFTGELTNLGSVDEAAGATGVSVVR
jgi:rhodanese-related sulfurtransferase